MVKQNVVGVTHGDVREKINENFDDLYARTVNVLDFGAASGQQCLAAFNAAHDSLSANGSFVGGTIVIPPGVYYFSGPWHISKRVRIVGAAPGDQRPTAGTALIFAENSSGIVFENERTSVHGSGSDTSYLTSVALHGSGTISGHGIDVKAGEVQIHNCTIRTFAGNAVNIVAYAVAQGTNANLFHIQNVRCIDNLGHGLYVEGADANAGNVIGMNCRVNGGWGFYDASWLGNTYIGCHSAGNSLGDYRGTGGFSGYFNCYSETEAGVSQSNIEGCGIVVGGLLATQDNVAGIYNVADGVIIKFLEDSRVIFKEGVTERGRIELDENGWGTCKFGRYKAVRVDDTATYANLEPGILALALSYSAGDVLRFDNPAGRVGSIVLSSNATNYNTSSDYRLKKDVLPIKDALNLIKKLNPVEFKWDSNDERSIGFLAHELQTVIPQCVTGEKDGDAYQQIDMSKIIPLVVAAVIELSNKLK